jgi:hypothetical protein
LWCGTISERCIWQLTVCRFFSPFFQWAAFDNLVFQYITSHPHHCSIARRPGNRYHMAHSDILYLLSTI